MAAAVSLYDLVDQDDLGRVRNFVGDVNVGYQKDGWDISPLMHAICKPDLANRRAIIGSLLDKGADLSYPCRWPDGTTKTPLMEILTQSVSPDNALKFNGIAGVVAQLSGQYTVGDGSKYSFIYDLVDKDDISGVSTYVHLGVDVNQGYQVAATGVHVTPIEHAIGKSNVGLVNALLKSPICRVPTSERVEDLMSRPKGDASYSDALKARMRSLVDPRREASAASAVSATSGQEATAVRSLLSAAAARVVNAVTPKMS